jgi:hypothetical protein
VPESSFAVTLLSLGTTSERAREIEGDLLEQARISGRGWYLRHLWLTAAALLCRSLAKDAVATALLAYAVYELALKLNWWLIRPVRLTLRFEWSLTEAQVALVTFGSWTLFAVAIGFTLVRSLSSRGFQVGLLAAGLLVLRTLLLDPPVGVGQVLGFGLLPLVAACWITHQRRVRGASLDVARHNS